MSHDWRSRIKKDFERSRKKDLDFQKRIAGQHAEYSRKEKIKQKIIGHYLRSASRCDYMNWLRGYLQNGGKVTHFYDYPFERHEFYIVQESFELNEWFCGAQSFSLIVPIGKDVVITKQGHVDIFYNDGYKKNSIIVPCYSNIINSLWFVGVRKLNYRRIK